VDERLQFWDKSFGSLTNQIIGNRYALGKAGAPYDLYLRTDLEQVQKGNYKVVWLMGIIDLRDGELKVMERLTKKDAKIIHTNASETIIYHKLNSPAERHEGKLSWTASELVQLWVMTSVHRYGNADDVDYAGRGWLSIHSIEGGKRIINLPFPAQVTDPVTDEIIHSHTREFQLELEPESTKLLRIQPIK